LRNRRKIKLTIFLGCYRHKKFIPIAIGTLLIGLCNGKIV